MTRPEQEKSHTCDETKASKYGNIDVQTTERDGLGLLVTTYKASDEVF